MPRSVRLILALVIAVGLCGLGTGAAYAHGANPGSSNSAEHAAATEHAASKKSTPATTKKAAAGTRNSHDKHGGSDKQGVRNTGRGSQPPSTKTTGRATGQRSALPTSTAGLGRLTPAERNLLASLRWLLTGRQPVTTATNALRQPAAAAPPVPLTQPAAPAAQLPAPLRSPRIRPFVPAPSAPGAGDAPGSASSLTTSAPAKPLPHTTNSSQPTSQDVPYRADPTAERPSSNLLIALLAAFGVAMAAMVVGAGHRGRREPVDRR